MVNLGAKPTQDAKPIRSAEPIQEKVPDRRAAARARLAAIAVQVQPSVRAAARSLTLAGDLARVLPQGLARGSVVTVTGSSGAGATSLTIACAAAATAAGEWAAFVEPDVSLGGLALADAGVALERCTVVRPVASERMASITAALLDGITCVIVRAHAAGFTLSDARRLRARARERSAVLVVHGDWPDVATVRLRAVASSWTGLDDGEGILTSRRLRVQSEGRGVAARVRVDELELVG